MESYLLKVLLVIVWSSLKYVVGFVTAVGAGFNFFEVLLINVGGGMIGVIVYLYLWDLVLVVYRKFFPPKKKKEGIRINNTRRWIVKIILKYELYGIAFLTPVLLSVPVGTLMAAAFTKDKWRIKRYMFISFLGWTLLLYGIYALFGIRIDEWF